jgi:hypothetical protein
MLLDDVGTYLAANSTRFTVGVNLTKGNMPENPATCTTLFETGGFSPLHAFTTGSQTRYYERPSIMVHSRSTDYQTVRDTMEAVFTILDGYNNALLPTATGVHYGSIDAVQSPFLINRDSNDRFVMSVNFNVVKTTG